MGVLKLVDETMELLRPLGTTQDAPSSLLFAFHMMARTKNNLPSNWDSPEGNQMFESQKVVGGPRANQVLKASNTKR